jgi:hypothetical protein
MVASSPNEPISIEGNTSPGTTTERQHHWPRTSWAVFEGDWPAAVGAADRRMYAVKRQHIGLVLPDRPGFGRVGSIGARQR